MSIWAEGELIKECSGAGPVCCELAAATVGLGKGELSVRVSTNERAIHVLSSYFSKIVPFSNVSTFTLDAEVFKYFSFDFSTLKYR